MVFLISLGAAILFVLMFGKMLRMHPAPFYGAAVLIAVAIVSVTWSDVAIPAALGTYVWPMLARGGLAGSFFVIVMFTGAFPNGSEPIKRLMPIRGQLSIIGSILTLSHNAAYGKVYFVRLFTDSASLPLNQFFAAVCSLLMLLIMLPLFVTSFQSIRRKMAPKTWKRLQRWAYGFYGLLACHILLLTVPGAMNGSRTYQLTVFVYGVVFLGYLVCRVSKALLKRTGSPRSLAKRQSVGVLCSAVVMALAVFCMGMDTTSDTLAEADQPTKGIVAGGAGESPSISAQPTENRIADMIGEESGEYKDGIYNGSAMGMNAPIEVSVTIENGTITDVTIVSSRDDEPYFADALEVIDHLLDCNSTQVDTVSGATYSSYGIIKAVEAALERAES